MAVGLRAVTGVSGIEDTSARALAKLEAVLPHRLMAAGQRRTRCRCRPGLRTPGTNVPDPEVDAELLMAVAAAIRDHEEMRFAYRDDQRFQVEPYRLVSWHATLVSGRPRRPSADAWSSFRLDWMQLHIPGGRRFTPVELPGGDYPAFVLRTAPFAGWQVHVRITAYASAADVAEPHQSDGRRR